MRFLGLVASQGGLFHLPENTFLKKVLQKRLNTKIFISDKPEFCGAIGAGLFAVDSDRLLERLECNALNINPKNLVILIGTNDIGIGVPTEYTLKNIKEILQRTQTLCSKYSGIKKASEHECSEVMADYINCQVFKGGDLSIWYQMKIIRVLRRILFNNFIAMTSCFFENICPPPSIK